MSGFGTRCALVPACMAEGQRRLFLNHATFFKPPRRDIAPGKDDQREFGRDTRLQKQTIRVVHRERGEFMPVMMTRTKSYGERLAEPSILLASDSERHGNTMHRALEQHGFAVEYAGDYTQVDSALHSRQYDVVLLEVTGEHAVEPAVEAALRVKRGNARQFVGYLADANLETSGLAGDAVFPRNAARLPDVLRRFVRDGVN